MCLQIFNYRFQLLSLISILITNCWCADTKQWSVNEICNNYNGRRIYLESNQFGTLIASNISVPDNTNKYTKVERTSNASLFVYHQCQLELITCPYCALTIDIIETNFTKICNKTDDKCECDDYLVFSEPPYDDKLSSNRWCGQPHNFTSQTRVLIITYFYHATRQNVFKLAYASQQNIIEKTFSLKNTTDEMDTFQSPFFPNFYPKDLSFEHIYTCDTGQNTSDCIFEIQFSDFQIGLSSTLEIFDNDNSSIGKYSGESFRPPIIYTNGSIVFIRFSARGDTGLGYRGKIKTLSNTEIFERKNRSTHCGGLVEIFGGAITMMNMIDEGIEPQLYDCIWIIKPPISYMLLKTHLLVRVDTFKEMAGKSVIEIREGVASTNALLQKIEWTNDSVETYENLITTKTNGFYISFSGLFDSRSKFAIVFTAFSYMECFAGPEFLCENHRCIPFYLQCDGFDHCGDLSDEGTKCDTEKGNDNAVDNHWYTHTPNYFFPKIEHYPDLTTATIVFLISTVGLLLLVVFLVFALYRMGHHVREQRELQSQLRTISEILDRETAQNIRRDDDDNQEQPPAYEAPPDYDEASVLNLEAEIRRSRRKSEPTKKRKRSQSRGRSPRNVENRWLYANSPSSMEPLISEQFLSSSSQLLPENDIGCAISSRIPNRRYSEFAIPHTRRNSQTLLIPDCPPPAYTPINIIIDEIQRNSTSNELVTLPIDIFSHADHSHVLEKYIDIINNDNKESITMSLALRRHSLQGNQQCEIFQQQIMNHFQRRPNVADDAMENVYQHLLDRSALNWLKNLNLKNTTRIFQLRRSSSENVLLLSPRIEVNAINILKRSFSSGLLFETKQI